MGMYTRLTINVAIRENTPSVALVRSLIDGTSSAEGRRAWMLASSSYYHDAINSVTFAHDDVSHCWKLSATFDLKNYDNEIEWFVGTIAADVETTALAGYKRYEGRAAPDLLWFIDGKAVWFTPELPPELWDRT